ncbi:MAG: glutamate--tRNA ligase [Chloroflexi bacterium]|nr:glutamate--tRNA ligase [Chloroflexota bacterium]
MTVRTRFAPSPTGYLHIGGVWAGLFAWLYARRHGGQFILRIEDTDTKRTVPGALESLMSNLRWFGIDWDEGPDIGGDFGPYQQTERKALYQKWANWLIEHDYAYKCFATPEELAEMRRELEAKGDRSGYDRRYRDLPAEEVARLEASGKKYVVRFKMPLDGQTAVPDLLRGDVIFENSQFTDYVLLKSDGLPTYHLAVVVDDHFMQISHITRGVEWLNTAPIHVNLYKAFGWEMPVAVHLPVILNPSGKGKLSKRHQAFQDGGEQILVRAAEFMEGGYLPEAILNFLANIGWTFGDDREKFTVAEAIARFDLATVSPTPIKLPYSKLDWLNSQYIQEMEPLDLAKAVRPYLQAAGLEINLDALLVVMPPMSVRLKRFPDAIPFLRFLSEEMPLPETVEAVTHKKLSLPAAEAAFREAREMIASIEPFTLEAISQQLFAIGEKHTDNGKAGPFLGTMRFAVTGQKVSPPLFESIVALGRDRVVQRLDKILALF